jgi:hypothetical protein
VGSRVALRVLALVCGLASLVGCDSNYRGSGTGASSPAGSSSSSSGGDQVARLPEGVSSVDIVIRRSTRAPTVSKSASGAAARELAATVNQLSPRKTLGVNCMADSGFRDDLTFHAPTSTATVTVKVGACGWVKLTTASATQVFAGSDGLDAQALHAAGLPPHYGN